MSVSVVKQTESFLWQYIWVLGSEVGYWVSRSQLHCSSGSEVRRGGFTGQCTGPDTLPVGAKFGREVIRFPHCVHMILSQLLERCPLSYRHTLNESRHTLRSSSAFRICEVKEYLQQSSSILDLSLDWTEYLGLVLQSTDLSYFFPPCLATPQLQRLAGGRDCWPAMFLALVVTPELREFLARAKGGAVRLIKVRIQDGEWPKTVHGGAGMSLTLWTNWKTVQNFLNYVHFFEMIYFF